MTVVQPPHDKLFRASMAIPIVAKQLLEAHLPVNVKSIIDINTLKLEKESFIDEELKNIISDVLFSVKAGDRDAYVYLLIEHQSKPHPWMAFKLFKYMLSICDRYLTENPKAKKLPLIYPMVFYNGRQKYNAKKNLWDLFENAELARSFWTGDHKIVNVYDIPDEEMKERPWAGLMELSMKHIRNPHLLEKWREIVGSLPEYMKLEFGHNYIRMAAFYTLTAIPKDDKMEFTKLVNGCLTEEEGEEIMASVAQEWWDGGIQEGLQKGRQEERYNIAINMINNGMSLVDVSKNTGLTMKELMLLCKERNSKSSN